MKKKLPKIIIKDTGRYGRGIFAGEDIKRGQVIYTLSGKNYSGLDLVEKVNSDKENIDDPLQVGKKTYIDLNRISRIFNHSCDPTAGVRKRSELFALNNIKKDAQITYDYSSVIAPTEFKMRCYCGSKKCRKIISDIRSIPKKQLLFYKEMGALQSYMKKIVTEINNKTYKIPRYELEALKKLKMTDNM
jgi:SET domain-containing protein